MTNKIIKSHINHKSIIKQHETLYTVAVPHLSTNISHLWVILNTTYCP